MTREEIRTLQRKKPNVPIGDLIHQHLQWEIISVKLLPGTRLNETQIAKELDLSRSPVKNAFDMLLEEGLLVKEPYKAPVVAPIDVKDCLQICQARISVEGPAAYLAAKTITPQQIGRLEELIEEYARCLRAKKDALTVARLDYQFHTAIVEASDNRYLVDMHRCIRSRTLRNRCYVQYLLGPEEARRELISREKSHDSILYALKNGLSSVAQEEMTLDINGMRDMFFIRRQSYFEAGPKHKGE